MAIGQSEASSNLARGSSVQRQLEDFRTSSTSQYQLCLARLTTAIVPKTQSLSTSQAAHRPSRSIQIPKDQHSRPYTMLRTSIARATGSSLRQVVRPSQASPAAVVSVNNAQQNRQAHAISNPTLANIEKRWEAMPPQEQADLWMALRDRMKVDWNEMTMQEKKAGT